MGATDVEFRQSEETERVRDNQRSTQPDDGSWSDTISHTDASCHRGRSETDARSSSKCLMPRVEDLFHLPNRSRLPPRHSLLGQLLERQPSEADDAAGFFLGRTVTFGSPWPLWKK